MSTERQKTAVPPACKTFNGIDELHKQLATITAVSVCFAQGKGSARFVCSRLSHNLTRSQHDPAFALLWCIEQNCASSIVPVFSCEALMLGHVYLHGSDTTLLSSTSPVDGPSRRPCALPVLASSNFTLLYISLCVFACPDTRAIRRLVCLAVCQSLCSLSPCSDC